MRFTFKIHDTERFVSWFDGDSTVETDVPAVADMIYTMIDNGLPVVIDLFQNMEPAELKDNYVAFGTISSALKMFPEITDIECDDVPDSWDEAPMYEEGLEFARREAAKALLEKHAH
jgi:hypothetical protein